MANPESDDERRVWGQAREFSEAIQKSAVVYPDEAATRYVQSSMDRLFPEFQGNIKVQLLGAPQLNAFAIPNGNIYMNLGLLAPDIQRAILENRAPAGLTANQLLSIDLPIAWADQRRTLGFAS